MKIYLKEVNALAENFDDFQIEVIPRQSNQEADALSKTRLVSIAFAYPLCRKYP